MNSKIAGRVTVIAIFALVAICGIFSATKKVPLSDKVWDERTTVGSMEAENYFIIYTDLMCPYCVAFENAILEHEEEFKDYIAENDILVEVKVSDFLFEYGESKPINSRYSAEATFCARNEDKFWDYYSHTIKTIWKDYFGASGKSAFTAMNKLDKNYWIGLGKEVGLGDSFASCVENDETLDDVIASARKTLEQIDGGMPYFKFNKYSFSGFDLSWGWDYVKLYFQKGLDNK